MASLNTDEEVQVEQGSQEMRSAELDELNEMDEFDESDELDRPLTPGSAGGLRPEADLISSSSRVSSNVGNMKPEQVGELIGIDLLDLAAAERHLVIDLIDLSTDPLNELYEKVYEAMLETKSDWSYPSSLAPDSLRKRFVLAAISQVTRWIKRQFNVDDRELKFDDEITFEVDFQGEWKYVTGGLVVCSKKKDAGAVVGENKHNRIKYHLAVVTNKMANCGEGLKQLLVYLRVSAARSHISLNIVLNRVQKKSNKLIHFFVCSNRNATV